MDTVNNAATVTENAETVGLKDVLALGAIGLVIGGTTGIGTVLGLEAGEALAAGTRSTVRAIGAGVTKMTESVKGWFGYGTSSVQAAAEAPAEAKAKRETKKTRKAKAARRGSKRP